MYTGYVFIIMIIIQKIIIIIFKLYIVYMKNLQKIIADDWIENDFFHIVIHFRF